jgi:hypothetical protein
MASMSEAQVAMAMKAEKVLKDYERGLVTLDEVVDEIGPLLEPKWVERQRRLLAENHRKYAERQSQ